MKKVCTGLKTSHPTLTHVPVTHSSNWPHDASVEKMPARVSWLHVKVPLMACNKPYQGTQKPCVPVPERRWRQKENPWREADWWRFFSVGGFWESYKAFMEPSQIEFPNRDKTWHPSYNNPSDEKHKVVLNIDGVQLTGSRSPPSI